MLNKRIATQIRVYRKNKKMTLEGLSKKVDIDDTYLGRVKEGCKNQSEVLQKTLKVSELNLDINISDNNIKELIKKNLQYEVHKRSNNEEEILKFLEARK